MKKFIIVIVILAVAAGVYYYFSKNAKAPSEPAINQNMPTNNSPTPTPGATGPNTQTNVQGSNAPDYTPPTSETGGENASSNIQVYEVDFTGSAFSPASQSVQVSDYIFFKNTSNTTVWIKSSDANHSSLDSGKAIAAGGEYKFQFTSAGDWNYFDSLEPSATGVVHVSQ